MEQIGIDLVFFPEEIEIALIRGGKNHGLGSCGGFYFYNKQTIGGLEAMFFSQFIKTSAVNYMRARGSIP